MSHTCHANFCNSECRPEHLMCRKHWSMVPGDIQTAVCSHYRPGQCQDMRPSKEWFDAANMAVAIVARKEGKGTSRHQRALLSEYDGATP